MFKDVVRCAKNRKLKWAGHIARMNDQRWTWKSTFWWPYHLKRGLGRPKQRWRTDLNLIEEKTKIRWNQLALNRMSYRKHVNIITEGLAIRASSKNQNKPS